MGFSAFCDVVKLKLYSFDVDEIMDVEFWSKLGGAQPSLTNKGSTIAKDHL
jgi:hypothetical protein